MRYRTPNFFSSTKLKENAGSFLKYIRWGGMPHLVNFPKEDAIIYEYLKNVHDTIILRDIIARFNKHTGWQTYLVI
jgi:predicted AAA+ superfamily ATPase